MFELSPQTSIYLYAGPIDFRKAINGLIYCVLNNLNKQPQSGDLFIFHNRSKDKIKALYWDGTGFVLYYKRMEKRRFILAKYLQGEINLTHEECALLLSGYDFTIQRERTATVFSHYY